MENNEESEITPDFHADVFSQHEWEDNGNEASTAVKIAAQVMHITHPAFIIVASPNMRMTRKGFVFPKEVGLSVNEELGITRSVVAAILREVADGLDADINKVMSFVHEAVGDTND